ncbi:ROK family transcriptional regulator [Amycolatopsis sp. FDAARGOS 1241]|uniref:ROK family transcriptional regulator n=1 Tax=Amycolatopsis sp. FDAARGOS 1241 TaxID=2778070 RepID=UPI00194EFE40|nr:ROK family transcriptional regulator [Amycolatopsis sp. FDAARGOS 1241]QRP48269.1 ROK family transcriptional regulator [Amycolatopsis sp. FDAARGOS 1241]
MTQAVRHDSMRARNLELVLGEVARQGPLTRAALAELTGLTKSTVSKLVGDLLDAGFLAETGPARAGERGRPGVEVALSGGRVASLGLEVNVDYLAVCLLDLTSTVRFAERRERDNRASEPAEVLGELQQLAQLALGEAAREKLTVAGAVLAVSGPVGDGVVFSAPNLGWRDVRAADLLRLPVPVALDNEANLGALGELWFGDGPENFLFVSGEVGIGAGLVVGSALFRGARGLAGELGHVVVSQAGPPCRCGATGCLETYAGQEALLEAAGVPTVAALLTALDNADPTATKATSAAGQALGLALASAINLLDLDHVVLGGVFAPLCPWLAPAAEAVLAARLGRLRGSVPVLAPSTVGGDAATLGAAGRTIHHVIADPGPFLSRAEAT